MISKRVFHQPNPAVVVLETKQMLFRYNCKMTLEYSLKLIVRRNARRSSKYSVRESRRFESRSVSERRNNAADSLAHVLENIAALVVDGEFEGERDVMTFKDGSAKHATW